MVLVIKLLFIKLGLKNLSNDRTDTVLVIKLLFIKLGLRNLSNKAFLNQI